MDSVQHILLFSFLDLPEGVQSDVTTPIIIGSVVAVLLLAAVAVVGVVLYKKRNGE